MKKNAYYFVRYLKSFLNSKSCCTGAIVLTVRVKVKLACLATWQRLTSIKMLFSLFRWLPYPQVKRRVIFNRSSVPDPIMAKPKNVIIQWEAPAVSVRKEIKYLGVIRANPAEYVSKFGASLKKPGQLPDFVLSIRTPDEIGVLAADYQYSNVYELEGNLDALKYVDLDREGLSEYKSQLSILGNAFSFNLFMLLANSVLSFF